LALYARVIFFPLAVHRLVEQLGDVEPVHHRLGVGQQPPAGVVERLGHVRPVRRHPPTLLRGQFFQALAGRRLVAALSHRQHRRPLRVGQVGQDRDEEPVPLLQAQLVDTHVADDPLGINLLGLSVGQLVVDDQADHLRRDAQPPGHLLLGAADEQAQHVLLEAVGVADFLAAEGRDEVLAVVAVRAAVVGRLVDPEAGLAPDVQVADDLDLVRELQVGGGVAVAAITAAASRPGPRDLKAVGVAVAAVGGDGHIGRQIDVDGDGGHRRLRGKRAKAMFRCIQAGPPTGNVQRPSGRENPKSPMICTLKRKSPFGTPDLSRRDPSETRLWRQEYRRPFRLKDWHRHAESTRERHKTMKSFRRQC